MATQFNGQLNSGIIYNSMYNAIIAIYQIKQHFTDSYSLVDRFRKEGSEYGDKLVYMTLDSIPVHDWTNDGEAANLLALDRNKKQHEEEIKLDVFKQIRLTTDAYMQTKQLWTSENGFSRFASLLLQTMENAKKVYEIKTFDVFVGTVKATGASQSATWDLTEGGPNIATDPEGAARWFGMKLAERLSNLMYDLRDVRRTWNDIEYEASYDMDEFQLLLPASVANQFKYISMPTIFDNGPLKALLEDAYVLPDIYFGDPVTVTGTEIKANGTTHRFLKSQFLGSTFYNAGDLIPKDTVIASTTAIVVPAYTMPDPNTTDVLLKLIHKEDCPYMSAYNVRSQFYNARSHTTNNYLTFAHNTLEHIGIFPLITIKTA